jgi:NADH-quinone oxidoreductase subunit J
MNDLEPIFFYLTSFVAISSALGVISSKRFVYSVLLLVISMIALSILFVLLIAHFVAMIQILIYAGAILVLFLLVNMLLGIEGEVPSQPISIAKLIGRFALFIVLAAELILAVWRSETGPFLGAGFPGTVEAVGEALFTEYLLPFELTSIILLIGIFGVALLSHKDKNRSGVSAS